MNRYMTLEFQQLATSGRQQDAQSLKVAQAFLERSVDARIEVPYVAAWALPGELSYQRLQGWFEFHLQVLQMRGQYGERVRLLRAPATWTDAELRLRGDLFERSYPDYWDLFESLESVADLQGLEPCFRSGGHSLSAEGVLALLNASAKLPAIQARLTESRAEMAKTAAELTQTTSALQRAQASLAKQGTALEEQQQAAATLAAALNAERQLVQDMSIAMAAERQTVQELNAALVAQQQAIEAMQAERAAERQQAASIVQSLTEERDTAAVAVQQLQSNLQESANESELLLLQLHQVQEELEKIFLDGEQSRQTLEAKEAQVKVVLEEKARLQQQISLLQSDLKKAKEAAEAELKKVSDAAADALKKAKASAEHDLKKAAEAAADELKKSKLAAEAELGKVRAATAADQQRLKDAESEGELLLLQLHQVQEELEKIFLDAEQVRQTLASKETDLKKSIEDKVRLEQQVKTLKAEIQTAAERVRQAEQSATVSQQAAEQIAELESKLKEADNENELLLLQLHQVQEELEVQFLNAMSLETEAKQSVDVLRAARTALHSQLQA